MTSASMHPTYPSQTLDSTSSHQPQSPSATRLPAQPPFLHPHRNQVLDSTQHHEQQHQQQEQASWYSSRAQDQGFDHSDPPAAPEHSSPAQNVTFTSDHHHNAQSTESYRPNYQAYNPQADRFSAFHSPPQPAAPPHHDPRQLPTSPHSDGSKHQGSLSRTSNLTIGTLRASYTSPHAQTRSDASVNDQHQGGPGRRQALTSDAHASSFDDTYKDSYEAPHAKREVKDDYGYGLPPLQHSYYSTPRSHREPNALFRTSESSPSASGSYSHASPSTSILPPPSHPSHSHHLHSSSSRFIPDDGPGGQSRYGHPNLSEAAPVAEFAAAATAPPAAASSSPSPPSSSSAHRQHHHLPPLSESFGSSFPRPTNSTMNFRPDGLGGPMPLAPSPLDHNGYPTAINTQVPGHGSAYALDHPFPNDYPGQGSPGLGSPGGLASNQASPLRSPAKRGKKVEMACHFCRGRKLKCDGVQPRCQHCTKRGQHCTWDSHVRRRGPGLKNKSKEPKGGVSKRRESVSTSTGRSTVSPKTPSRHSLDDPLEGHHRGPSEIMTPDGELPYPAYPIKGEEMEGDVPLTTGTNSPFAHPPYPAPSSAFAQVPAQDPYATAQYPGQQHPHYGPPSPSVPRVIMSRTPSSSLAGAMGPDPNYSAYHASDSDQGSAVHHQDSTWRRHSIAGGQCADPSAYISETTGGGAVYWDRDNASDGGEGAYAYHQTSPTTSTSAQYFNSQAVHHGYAQQQQQQQQQQYPGSPSSSMVYGTQQEYAQHRAYATSRDNHHQQHQQQQVSPPIPGYEAEWIAHAAGEPGQACWNGHVGHASSAEVNASGDSAVTHNPSSFSEIRVQGSVSPSQETDPSSYHARSTSGTVSSSSTHSSPAQLPNELYHHHHYHSPPSSTPVASRTTRPAMPSSSSVDNDLAQSLINLAHGPPASGPSVPRMNNASGAAVGHGPALTFKNALGSNNSPHSGHEVVY
ncbi:hypothetical protein FRC01_003790 [Tulasnella sp. 417]|nr:hypothetical protein FRC01_003790 [Tulasnella sp. 417]